MDPQQTPPPSPASQPYMPPANSVNGAIGQPAFASQNPLAASVVEAAYADPTALASPAPIMPSAALPPVESETGPTEIMATIDHGAPSQPQSGTQPAVNPAGAWQDPAASLVPGPAGVPGQFGALGTPGFESAGYSAPVPQYGATQPPMPNAYNTSQTPGMDMSMNVGAAGVNSGTGLPTTASFSQPASPAASGTPAPGAQPPMAPGMNPQMSPMNPASPMQPPVGTPSPVVAPPHMPDGPLPPAIASHNERREPKIAFLAVIGVVVLGLAIAIAYLISRG